jgi:hypothetical protein
VRSDGQAQFRLRIQTHDAPQDFDDVTAVQPVVGIEIVARDVPTSDLFHFGEELLDNDRVADVQAVVTKQR